MARITRKNKKPGLSPGTLLYTGKKYRENIEIDLIDYSENYFFEKKNVKLKEIDDYCNTTSITWINVEGLHETEVIADIGKIYGIHTLTMEDILHLEQLPKVETFDSYIFTTVKMLSLDSNEKVEDEQLGIILGKNFVITFQEGKDGDVFEPLRDRIRKGNGRIRGMAADYLYYAILDIIIDNYFVVMEEIGEKIAVYEEKLMFAPEENIIKEIYSLKREIIFLRKSIVPLREMILKIQHCECELIETKTEIFLRDLYDHSLQVIDMVETYREMVSGLLELYLSSLSNRMNEVMRTLTTISTIFIPLTFIVGVYGMNFVNMPELKFKYGYYIIWGFMIGIGIFMYKYFKNKKWI